MFEWLKPKGNDAPKTPSAPAQKDAAKDRATLIKEAMHNARHAREAIGEETLDRVLAMMQKKKAEESMESLNPSSQARKIIEKLDKGHVADHLKDLMQGDHSPSKH